ncbi:hypothetical protein [Algivirga pacifica]|uniref:Uncharacterized protein n=1 Tax=Algivirga pacifica TaxID=1162670 RepID=A0ABP9D2E2_9BACT
MQNDPTLNGKYLGSITQDFLKVANALKESAYQIKARKISEFPIFPIAKEELLVGQLLIGIKDKPQLNWNYHISFAEEFVQRNLIEEDKLEEFVANYKDPEEYCCLFVVDEGFVNFVYVPYPLEED